LINPYGLWLLAKINNENEPRLPLNVATLSPTHRRNLNQNVRAGAYLSPRLFENDLVKTVVSVVRVPSHFKARINGLKFSLSWAGFFILTTIYCDAGLKC